MSMFGEKKIGKSEVRELAVEVNKITKVIDGVTQSEIDRISDKIDAELHSCGRELSTATSTLNQVKPLIDRLVMQIKEQGAPDSIQILLGSVAQEVMSKVESVKSNVIEVQQNIKDVDAYTDAIDKKTDDIDALTDQINNITEKYLK